MTGLAKMILTLAALVAAGLGIIYVWTGTVPADLVKVAGTFGICAALAVFVKLISYSPAPKRQDF